MSILGDRAPSQDRDHMDPDSHGRSDSEKQSRAFRESEYVLYSRVTPFALREPPYHTADMKPSPRSSMTEPKETVEHGVPTASLPSERR